MRIAFGLAIIALPFQLQLFIFQGEWGRGFVNPYTAIHLSASELLLFLSAAALLIDHLFFKRKIRLGDKRFLFLVLLFMTCTAVATIFAPGLSSIYQLMLVTKLLSLFIAYFLVVNKVLAAKDILEIFTFTMTAQAGIAIVQVLTQSDIGLHLLGEPIINSDIAHLARFNFQGLEIIRAYGTFSHPNVLGGFLLISICSTLLFEPHLRYERRLFIALQFIALLASFSRSAMLMLIISGLMIFYWYMKEIAKMKSSKIPILLGLAMTLEVLYIFVFRGLNFTQDPNILSRVESVQWSIQLFGEHPMGVGFMQFTEHIDSIVPRALMPWEYQPVHNIFLLSLAELGILGFSALVLLLGFASYKLYHKRKSLLTNGQQFKKRVLFVILLSILVISCVDHYFYTLPQGRLLLFIILGIISRFSKNPRFVLPIKKGESLNKMLTDQE